MYWAVLECTGLYWAVLDCTGLYWAALGCNECDLGDPGDSGGPGGPGGPGDMHSENIWFSGSKPSNYREKLRCHTRDGRTDEQTNGRTEKVENRAVFWWTRNRKKEIGSQEICMPGILMPSPFPALQMKNCHYFLALPLAVSFGSICFDCWLKAH